MPTTTDERRNGHATDAPPAPTAGPRIPRREAWLDMPGEYGQAGFKARVWLNYPQRLAQELASEDQERIKAALTLMVLEHNGWCDEDGTPFPPATDPAFWDAIPNELAGCVVGALMAEVTKLPNSLQPTRRR